LAAPFAYHALAACPISQHIAGDSGRLGGSSDPWAAGNSLFSLLKDRGPGGGAGGPSAAEQGKETKEKKERREKKQKKEKKHKAKEKVCMLQHVCLPIGRA
jgi:hypothetical protein